MDRWMNGWMGLAGLKVGGWMEVSTYWTCSSLVKLVSDILANRVAIIEFGAYNSICDHLQRVSRHERSDGLQSLDVKIQTMHMDGADVCIEL